MKVYIGSAIDTAKTDPTVNFKDLQRVLKQAFKEVTIYNPMSAYVSTCDTIADCKYVVGVNTTALLGADLALFLIDDNPSFGVPVEVWMAAEKRLETIVWWRASKNPGLYIKSLQNNRFHICESETEVISTLQTLVFRKDAINFPIEASDSLKEKNFLRPVPTAIGVDTP